MLVLLIVTLIKVIRGSCHGFVVQMIVFLIVSNLATLLNHFAGYEADPMTVSWNVVIQLSVLL